MKPFSRKKDEETLPPAEPRLDELVVWEVELAPPLRGIKTLSLVKVMSGARDGQFALVLGQGDSPALAMALSDHQLRSFGIAALKLAIPGLQVLGVQDDGRTDV